MAGGCGRSVGVEHITFSEGERCRTSYKTSKGMAGSMASLPAFRFCTGWAFASGTADEPSASSPPAFFDREAFFFLRVGSTKSPSSCRAVSVTSSESIATLLVLSRVERRGAVSEDMAEREERGGIVTARTRTSVTNAPQLLTSALRRKSKAPQPLRMLCFIIHFVQTVGAHALPPIGTSERRSPRPAQRIEGRDDH
jgi:hypothetical protein